MQWCCFFSYNLACDKQTDWFMLTLCVMERASIKARLAFSPWEPCVEWSEMGVSRSYSRGGLEYYGGWTVASLVRWSVTTSQG